MGILSHWGRHRQQRSCFKPTHSNINSNSQSNHRNGRRCNNGKRNFFVRCIRHVSTKQFHIARTWSSLPIYAKLSRTRHDQPNSHTEGHHHPKRHRYNKYIYPVIATLLSVQSLPSRAEGVGGVSATANPIANSSGSVTNQAIQVLQGPYVTNTYGGGVSVSYTHLTLPTIYSV